MILTRLSLETAGVEKQSLGVCLGCTVYKWFAYVVSRYTQPLPFTAEDVGSEESGGQGGPSQPERTGLQAPADYSLPPLSGSGGPHLRTGTPVL